MGEHIGARLTLSAPSSADEALYRADVADMAAVAARAAGDPRIEPVVPTQALGFPDDPLWDAQWNMRQIGAPDGWSAGADWAVTVAVLDTGVS